MKLLFCFDVIEWYEFLWLWGGLGLQTHFAYPTSFVVRLGWVDVEVEAVTIFKFIGGGFSSSFPYERQCICQHCFPEKYLLQIVQQTSKTSVYQQTKTKSIKCVNYRLSLVWKLKHNKGKLAWTRGRFTQNTFGKASRRAKFLGVKKEFIRGKNKYWVGFVVVLWVKLTIKVWDL